MHCVGAVRKESRHHPEPGFKEFKTSRLVAQTFDFMGLAPASL